MLTLPSVQRGGVFLDLGAGDGEYKSITLPLEKSLGWSGMLVEPHPRLYQKLLKKARKAEASRLCVSPYSYPAKVSEWLVESSVSVKEDDYPLLLTLKIYEPKTPCACPILRRSLIPNYYLHMIFTNESRPMYGGTFCYTSYITSFTYLICTHT